MDENPYAAPQASTPVARRTLPPNLALAVITVASQVVAYRIAFSFPIPKWAAYLIGALVGALFFMVVIFVLRTIRRHRPR